MNRRQLFLNSTIFLLIFLNLTLNPFADENPVEQGIKQYKAENYEGALELFIKAREQQPDSSLAAYYLGMTSKQMGNYREAVKNFREAIHLDPPVREAYLEIIESLYNLNEFPAALNWVKNAEKEQINPGQTAF